MINANSSFPVFIVKDLRHAEEFYTAYFGFDVAFSADWYLHLVSDTGVQIGFMLPNQPTQPYIFHRSYAGEGVILSLEVDDAEDAYLQAQEKRLDIVLSLRSEEWGQKHFSVRDPNGIVLDVVQAIAPSEEYQSKYSEDE